MSLVKDLWMAEYERIRDKLIEGGCPEDLADEIASERAYDGAGDRLADMADNLRKRDREDAP
jgi:hypothetical protein